MEHSPNLTNLPMSVVILRRIHIAPAVSFSDVLLSFAKIASINSQRDATEALVGHCISKIYQSSITGVRAEVMS